VNFVNWLVQILYFWSPECRNPAPKCQPGGVAAGLTEATSVDPLPGRETVWLPAFPHLLQCTFFVSYSWK